MSVTREGNFGLINLGQRAFSFHIQSADSAFDFDFFTPDTSKQWESDPLAVGPFQIVSFGQSNNMPVFLRDIIEDNNLAEGILKRQRGLLWGQGPELYRSVISNNQRIKEWTHDTEVSDWLSSWDYQTYLLNTIVDYFHTECTFTKVFRNRGPRVGNPPRIASLQFLSVARCRLEWPADRINPQRIITGDFDEPSPANLAAFPVFRHTDPFRFPVSIMFSNMASFARRFYGVPAYFGAINWLRKASSIPKILTALTDNSLNIKWHIKSPASYWDAKRDILQQQCTLKGLEYKEDFLEQLKDSTFQTLASVLAGEKNVGKFFTSETVRDELGNLDGWEIIPIDQKVKDFIDSQIRVADKADSATTSGLGLHPSLSNVMVDGKLASGSEQLYALKLYLATEIDIPELIVTRAVNAAIAANWPDKQLRLGFYHHIVKSEDATTSSQRVKNVV